MKKLLLLSLAIALAAVYFPLDHSRQHMHVLAGSLDDRLPLVSAFAIPYILLLPVFWLTVAYAFFKDKLFIKLGLILVLVFAVSDLFFLVFPTHMPRPTHYGYLIRFVYSRDNAYNDFPSGHALMATILALYFWQKPGRARLIVCGLSVLVVTSTVLVKQHSIIGALAGVLLGLVGWFIINPPLKNSLS